MSLAGAAAFTSAAGQAGAAAPATGANRQEAARECLAGGIRLTVNRSAPGRHATRFAYAIKAGP